MEQNPAAEIAEAELEAIATALQVQPGIRAEKPIAPCIHHPRLRGMPESSSATRVPRCYSFRNIS